MQANFIHFAMLFFRLPKVAHDRQHRYQRIARVVRRMRWALGLMLFTLLVGTAGYMIIEGYPLFDAYYMAVITLASVGFGEIHPLSTAGRVFTSLLILFNVGLFAYGISTLTGLLAEGGLSKLLQDFRMHRNIEQLRNHTIVCGFGRHATEVATELSKQNHPFVIIETKPDKIEQLKNETDYLFIEGDATLDGVLAEAGIEHARSIVVTLPSDADNMFITLSARQINPDIRIISRAGHEADEVKIQRAGANHTVVPERIGGFYMATLVNNPDLVEFFNLLSNMGPSNVVFNEVAVADLPPFYHFKTLESSCLMQGARVSLVAVRQTNGKYELNPVPETRLEPELHLVLLGNAEQMEAFWTNVRAVA